MNFECCDCKKTFVYAAKLTQNDLSQTDLTKSLETHVCPYCKSLNIQEHVEAAVVEKICSVKSVELDKVDDMIKEGYEVKELYAKSATMIKKEAKA